MYEIKLVTSAVFITICVIYIISKLNKGFLRGMNGVPGPMGEMGPCGMDGKDNRDSLYKILSNTTIKEGNAFEIDGVSVDTSINKKVHVDAIEFIGSIGVIKLKPLVCKNKAITARSGRMEIHVNDVRFSSMSLKDVSEYNELDGDISLYVKNGDIIKLKVFTNRKDLFVKCKICSANKLDYMLFKESK